HPGIASGRADRPSVQSVADRGRQGALRIIATELPDESTTEVLRLDVAHLLGDQGRRVVAPERVAVVDPRRARLGVGEARPAEVLEHLVVLDASLVRA